MQVNSHHSIGIDLLDDLLDFTRHREWEVAVVEAVLEQISLMGKLPLKSEQPECEKDSLVAAQPNRWAGGQ